MNKRFFNKNPEIFWSKVLCPMCGQPSGPESECYKNPPANIPPHKRKIIHNNLGVLPIYSTDCVFRQDNLWQATINYPFSEPLCKTLSQIDGLEKIYPIKQYTFQVSIARMFNAKDVKREINSAYRNFIKEMEVIEINSIKDEEAKPQYVGIQFPNGQEFKIDSASADEIFKQSQIIENIIDMIPGTKGILSKNGSFPEKGDIV